MFPETWAFRCASGLAGPLTRALSWVGKTPSRGLRRLLSLRRGGELVFACFSLSSASRSLRSRASSSWVCVETACFLCRVRSRAGYGRHRDILLVNVLVKIIEVAVELEQTVELGHEVARDSAACCGQRTGTTLAPGEHTIEDGCLASNPAATRLQGSPWRRRSRAAAFE